MSISRLPSGRWRAQIHDPSVGHNVSVSKVLGPGYSSFRTKTEAKVAREEARRCLTGPASGMTVAEFRERWLTNPLFKRPKASTMLHNRERTRAFAAEHADIPIRAISDAHVSAWLTKAKHAGTIPALRAMFNDAASAKAGRLVQVNPFAGLGISRGPGNRHKQPPSEAMVWALIEHARTLSGPYFAAWLQVAAFTGIRPGELDALRWDCVDFVDGTIHVAEQWSAGARAFTTPKNGRPRNAPLTNHARDALMALPRDGDFCFVNLHNEHFTPASRAYHWKAIRAAAGYTDTLYMATRHFAGWYMTNVLGLAAEDVAIALGHSDGGYLVRNLYGHIDHALALRRVADAYAAQAQPLRIVDQRREA